MKYKVGDRGRVRPDLKVGERYSMESGRKDSVVEEMAKWKGKTVTIEQVGAEYRIKEDGWSWTDEMFEKVNSKIVITSSGSETLARLYEGNTVIKTATAKRSPEDIFNFETGAKIAFDRLIENKPADKWRVVNRPVEAGDYIRITEPSYSFDKKGDILKVSRPFGTGCFVRDDEHYEWCYCDCDFEVVEPIETHEEKPKYYNGKVVCVKSEDIGFTIGKVYEVVDGRMKDDDGSLRPKGYKITELSEYRPNDTEFISLVE